MEREFDTAKKKGGGCDTWGERWGLLRVMAEEADGIWGGDEGYEREGKVDGAGLCFLRPSGKSGNQGKKNSKKEAMKAHHFLFQKKKYSDH